MAMYAFGILELDTRHVLKSAINVYAVLTPLVLNMTEHLNAIAPQDSMEILLWNVKLPLYTYLEIAWLITIAEFRSGVKLGLTTESVWIHVRRKNARQISNVLLKIM